MGVGITFATVGMVGGILIGIAFLNIAARKGWTKYVKSPEDVPEEMRTGLIKDVEKRPSAGTITTAGGSIDTLALHAALMLLAVGIGYICSWLINKFQIPWLIYMSTWFWSLLAMYIIWPIVCKLGCDKYFDPQVKGRITGGITDIIVTAAIMSMPISLIMKYWLPILVTAIAGFVVTVFGILLIHKYLLQEDWVEKSMGPLGMMTGDFITGVLLTRMADPDFKSNAMQDFSIAYSLNTFYCVALAAVIYPYIVTKGAFSAMLFTGGHMLALLAALIIFTAFTRKKAKAA